MHVLGISISGRVAYGDGFQFQTSSSSASEH